MNEKRSLPRGRHLPSVINVNNIVMPQKKPGNKSSKKDIKKVKHVKNVSERDPPIAEPHNIKLSGSAIQRNATLVESEAPSTSSQLMQTALADHNAENKRYSKRKIQSNWEKYEIPDETHQELEHATTRGYDFELIQNAGGGIGSHFQFKDEKNWTDELGSDSDSINQLQSLNLNSLAISLSCIPFHQRLGIDPIYFMPEQISKFEAVAELQRINFQNESVVPEKEEDKIWSTKPTQLLPSPIEIQAKLPIKKNICTTEASSSETSSQDILKNVDENEMPIDAELEDELDALLAINKEKVHNMPCIEMPKSTLIPENVNPTLSIVKPRVPVSDIAAGSKESFEDWLDSALED